MSADILARIAAYKHEEVAARKQATSLENLQQQALSHTPPRGFFRALEQESQAPNRLGLIAEIKKASPSKGVIREDFDPVALARAYQAGGAACLSILTDGPSFQGHETYLTEARAAVALPVIRKDFLVDPWQVLESRAMGADAILIIMAMIEDELARDLYALAHELGMDALVEVHNDQELDRALLFSPKMIGVNNRDLKSFKVDLAVTEALATRIPPDVLLVTESGVFTPQDVTRMGQAGARAMLVGESLMRQADVVAATRQLLSYG